MRTSRLLGYDAGMTSEVRRFDSLADLSGAAAVAVVHVMKDAIQLRGHCSIVLSGGKTPKTLYHLLATTHRNDVNWGRVHLFWGDERWVPATDPRSNVRMAREALIDRVHCPPEHVHAIPVDASSPAVAARDYARTLHTFFRTADAGPDLVLLGMGSDGHTASLFPHSPALDEPRRWAVPSFAPVEPRERVTLTMPAINLAKHIFLLVAGPDKQSAFDAVISGHADPHRYPVAMVQPANGTLTWWVTPMA
jgi:6-phosphogluconolactonase